MNRSARTYAEFGVQHLESALQKSPPPGVTASFLERFFAQYRGVLVEKLENLLAGPAIPFPRPDDLPPDERTAAERTAANLIALRILASGQPLSPGHRADLLRYSGWGGLSIDKIADQLPAGFRPEARGHIHEYYTPTRVAREVARIVRPLLPALAEASGGEVWALEPSAGIGRFLHSFSGEGFESLRWRAVEWSLVSARLLQALRPDIAIFQGPFERWVEQHGWEVAGKLGLIVANPPYGQRGAAVTEDRDPAYRERKAYAYFLRRGLDLLRPFGLGIFLIPYGFLSGQSPELRKLREKVLVRHHLSGAYRLPSNLFPGALLVTDLLFFRARGGELGEVYLDDRFVLDGHYFQHYPEHILGQEVGQGGAEDDTAAKPRWGYQVEGIFTTLPALVERPMCRDCAPAPYKPPARPVEVPEEELPEPLPLGKALGGRVAEFMNLLAAGDESSLARVALLYPELRAALDAWSAAQGNPHQNPSLQRFAQKAPHQDLGALLAAFAEDGTLVPALEQAPRYVPRYTGAPEDAAAQALFLFKQRRRLNREELREWHAAHFGVLTPDTIEQALVAAAWCFDGERGEELWPAEDYYSGALWPKYDRARQRAASGDSQAAAQAARLLERIAPIPFAEVTVEPRSAWIPANLLAAWIQQATGSAEPLPLERESSGMLAVQGVTLTEMSARSDDVRGVSRHARMLLGYLNHDMVLFRPPADKKTDPETQKEESAAEALDRARIEFHEKAQAHFARWLAANPAQQRVLADTYNRLYRGFVPPQYGHDELPIARWSRAKGAIQPRPWQRSAARRLIAQRGGLCALGVGLGKTYTGILVVAVARQEGWARRPLVVVPNTLLWKWYDDFHRVLPDYRVAVIGSERYIDRQSRRAQRPARKPPRHASAARAQVATVSGGRI